LALGSFDPRTLWPVKSRGRRAMGLHGRRKDCDFRPSMGRFASCACTSTRVLAPTERGQVCLLATGSPERVVLLYPCIKILLVGVTDARTNKGRGPTITSRPAFGGGGAQAHAPSKRDAFRFKFMDAIDMPGKSPSQMVLKAKCLSK